MSEATVSTTTATTAPPTVGAMPVDSLARLARADARYRRAVAAYEAARESHREAIVTAFDAGLSLGEIAETIGLTHEFVRKVVRRAGR